LIAPFTLVPTWVVESQEQPVGKVAKPLRAAGPQGVQPWSLTLSAEQRDDTNVQFQPGGIRDQVGRLGGTLSYTATGQRTALTLAADGSGLWYRELSALDTVDYGGSVSVSRRLTQHSTLTLRDGVASRNSNDQPSLTEEGLLLPLARSLTNRAALGLESQLSARTSLSVSARHELARFDTPALSDGTTLSAGTVLRRRLRRADSVSADYTYSQSISRDVTIHLHTASVGWSGALGRRVLVELQGGASNFRHPLSTSAPVTPTGAAGLTGRLDRHALGVRYSRAVNQAYGEGRLRAVDLVSAVYSGGFGRLSLSANASRAISKDVAGSDFRFDSDTLGVEARWLVAGGWDLLAAYSWRERTDIAAPPTRSRALKAGLVYRVDWGVRRQPPEPPTDTAAGGAPY
jgi:hypothetical protein